MKTSSYKMIEKSLNFARFEGAPYLVHYSLLMTQYLSSWSITFQTQARIRSQSPSKGKNFPVNLHLINQVKLMQKISSNLKNFHWSKFMLLVAVNIYFKDAISSIRNYYASKHGIVQPQNLNIFSKPRSIKIKYFLIYKDIDHYSSTQRYRIGGIFGYILNLSLNLQIDFFKWVDQQISLRFNAVFSNPNPKMPLESLSSLLLFEWW